MKRTVARIQSFRRGQSVARRRRTLLVRLLRPFVAALALVGVPVAVGAWLLCSPRFTLRELSVEVGPRVGGEWVQEAMRPFRGRNLLLLVLAEVEDTLESHPWVRGVELRKELPDRLRVKVVEREPVALLVLDDGMHYLEADGYVIPPRLLPEEAPPGLLRVHASKAPEGVPGALQAARQLAAAAPDWYEQLSRIEVLSKEEFRLETAALPFPLLVRAGAAGQKVASLKVLMPWIEARFGGLTVADLRFSRRVVLQPRVVPDSPGAHPLNLED